MGTPPLLHAQAIDSLLQLKDDTVKLSLLKKKAVSISEDDPAQALRIAEAGILLARKLGQPVSEGELYKAAGVAYDVRGNLDSCLYMLKNAERIFIEKNERVLLANTISDIALAYYFRGIYESSLRNHFEALKIREANGDKSLIAKSYNNLGLVYRARKDYPNAIRYYQLSLALKKELKDSAGMLNSLMNIGSCFQYQRKYDSALNFSVQTLAYSRTLGKKKDEANSYTNLGVACAGLGKWDMAEIYLNNAKALADSLTYKEPLFGVYEGLGNVQLHKKDYTGAIDWFNKGVKLASDAGRKEMLANYYNSLADCYEKKGDYNLAYNYIRNSTAIRDSLLNEENLRQLNEMNTLYETAQKEETIGELNKEARSKEITLARNRRERNYLIIAAILATMLGGLAYYAYRNNLRKKELLNKQNMLIESSLKEKETLLREIHHRVKNNLQIISGLLHLQSRQIENPEAQEAVREGRNRVKSMALIHQKLYQQDNMTAVNLKEYLEELCGNIQQTFVNNTSQITATIDCEIMDMDTDTAIPLGLIVNELLTNSYKYAFEGMDSGRIHISIKRLSNEIEMEIRDNGKGLPRDFNPNQQQSFGMKLVYSLSAKLEAEITSNNENGAVFLIRFPYTKKN